MDSKIVNEYGAFRGEVIEDLEIVILEPMTIYIKTLTPELEPEDIRLLENFVHMYVSGRFSEIILYKALVKKKMKDRECLSE